MIRRFKKSWRVFADSRPGRRFRDRYHFHQSRRRGPLDPIRLLYLCGGGVLIIFSALFGWLPVLGWGTVFLGLGMIAGEFYPAARLMDWGEVKARRVFGPLGRTLKRMPAWAQLSLSLAVAAGTFILMYQLFYLTLSSQSYLQNI